METMTRDERTAALDKFARTTADENVASLPVPVTPPHAQLVVGAQAVAVRRDEALVLQKLKVLATAAGDDWYYRFPVRNRRTGQTDYIEGPSIKLANDLARLYGNCEVDCRAQDLGSVILYHARFLDLETGFALTRPFQQRKGAAKIGGDDDARKEDITFQIGASKAIRNVVVNALQTFADFAFDEAKNALVDKVGKDIERYRRVTAERISARLDIKRVESVVGRTVEQWLAADISRVIAMGKAVEDGMATWDETFPPLKKDEPKTEERLDQFTEIGAEADPSGAKPAGGTETAPAGPAVNPTGPADAQRIAIGTALRLANNSQLTEQEKLEQLEQMEPLLHDEEIPGPFIKTVLKTAADVARGKMKIDDARRYLEGMVK